MALSLACSCGARFEVEDTFAGQSVSCPECQQSVQAPGLQRPPLRTSGYAVASAVLALVLAFTGIGTIVAVILGAIGLVHIKRHRDQVTGAGFAIFGIASGLVFTVLFGLAIVRTDLFGSNFMGELFLGEKVDRSGPLEITRSERGFAIRRPTNKWGVTKSEVGCDLTLVNVARGAFVDVTREELAGRTLEVYRDQVLDNFKQQPDPFGKGQPLQFNGLTIRESQSLATEKDRETIEVLLDVNLGLQPFTFLLRIIRPKGSNNVFVVRGWALRRKFPTIEGEVRQALESFRILQP
jgi:hypothetical protein